MFSCWDLKNIMHFYVPSEIFNIPGWVTAFHIWQFSLHFDGYFLTWKLTKKLCEDMARVVNSSGLKIVSLLRSSTLGPLKAIWI